MRRFGRHLAWENTLEADHTALTTPLKKAQGAICSAASALLLKPAFIHLMRWFGSHGRGEMDLRRTNPPFEANRRVMHSSPIRVDE
jgi:hypothetical protein